MDATTAFVAQHAPRDPSAPLQGTASAAGAIKRVNYSHDAMIDLIVTNPDISQNELAAYFGYSVGWVSRVRNSDAFLARLAERKADLVDPSIAATVDEKIRAVADRAWGTVLEKIDKGVVTFDQALNAAEKAGKALGYGARAQNVNVQQNFVVALPQKAPTAEAWATRYAGPTPDLAALKAAAQDVEVKNA